MNAGHPDLEYIHVVWLLKTLAKFNQIEVICATNAAHLVTVISKRWRKKIINKKNNKLDILQRTLGYDATTASQRLIMFKN